MRNDFRQQDHLISNRVFWVGLALYAVSLTGAVTVFGSAVPENSEQTIRSANYSGTLIFGNARPETNESYRLDLFRHQDHYGAVTFRRNLAGDFSPRTNWSASNINAFHSVPSQIAESPMATATASGSSQKTFSGASDTGFNPMQIALGEQSSSIGEDVVPASEPATWFAAILVAGALASSQRRRFTRGLAQRRSRLPQSSFR